MSNPPKYKKIYHTKNPLDPTTFNLDQNITVGAVPVDEEGNIILQPVFLSNPQLNPITASGTIGNVNIKDPSSGNLANVVGSLGAASGNVGLVVYQGFPANVTIVSASAAAGSTQLVATGGAGVKYRIYGLSLSITGAVNVASTATINEVTSGTVIMQLHLAAQGAGVGEASMSKTIAIPQFGVLQPTANNAIQVTATGAGSTADAELIYST